MPRPRLCAIVWTLVGCAGPVAVAADGWVPAGDHIRTRWAADVDPAHPLPEYPRPQMVRDRWTNLNGLWDFATTAAAAPPPAAYPDHILVPFAAESSLSGLARAVGPDQRAWYRRAFDTPALAAGDRLLLHFGGVDWATDLSLNNTPVGAHRGGYDAFTFDVTDALRPGPTQTLVVSVTNPVDTGSQPRGKQILHPRGIWYTAATGIWQTVWLEVVPAVSVDGLTLTPDLPGGRLHVTVTPRGDAHDVTAEVTATADGKPVGRTTGPVGTDLTVPIADVRPWSPDAPFLYDLTVRLRRGDQVMDHVSGYFGLRSVAVKPAPDGVVRTFVNGRPTFLLGPLDQGYWPDGLYTAPTDAALRADVETIRRYGFNAVRKHVKVEPARWYYWCDKLGLMVLQDMPCGFQSEQRADAKGTTDAAFTAAEAEQFRTELRALVDGRRNSPAVIGWVPFNEGMGQHDTADLTRWLKAADPGRFVDATSGWVDRGCGDLHDMHHYPAPAMFPVDPPRASFLGEYGGLGLPVPGHTWTDEKNWGYQTAASPAAETAQFVRFVRQLEPLAAAGLTGAVYTQLTDVEREVNGLETYDRAVVKVDPDVAAAAVRRLIAGPATRP